MKTSPSLQADKRSSGRVITGVVVKRSGDKTVSVDVATSTRHAVYGKPIKRTKGYLAHDEKNQLQAGDMVTIREVRPLSARKRWVAAPAVSSKQ